ncbi:hypothetical protein T439DRAFT_320970 [Meredithblackwellia eburnea MCA 4105]
MGLSQESVAKFIKRCTTDTETEEVLAAYCFSKYVNGGNSSQVQRKLHLLTLYLRAIDLGSFIVLHYSAFAVTAYLVKNCPPTGPHFPQPKTIVGCDCWNAARRPSRSIFKRATSAEKIKTFLSTTSPSSSNANSDTEEDAGNAGGGRQRIVADDEARRLAAGTGIGLMGRGLLSSPPGYDNRISEHTNVFPQRAAGWEFDVLPGYAAAA